MSVVVVDRNDNKGRQEKKTAWKRFHQNMQLLPVDSDILRKFEGLASKKAKDEFLQSWIRDPSWQFCQVAKDASKPRNKQEQANKKQTESKQNNKQTKTLDEKKRRTRGHTDTETRSKRTRPLPPTRHPLSARRSSSCAGSCRAIRRRRNQQTNKRQNEQTNK
jgi:hypothetical protein